MDNKDAQKLGKAIRAKREALKLSASEVARQANVAKATITRLELAQIPNPRIDNLRSIADVLGLPITDLLTEASWLRDAELPTLTPYLRTKFKDMPADAVKEIEQHFQDVAARHGVHLDAANGPAPGEDE